MQRSFLNLTHNPFVAPREGFFGGGDRQTHLDQLRHLSQWSRRILLLTGPFGIGKSTLYRELSNTLEPTAKAARLSGTVATTERDVLVSLVQGFGIASAPDASVDEMHALIVAHAEEQETQNRFCVVMVDEGHLLDPMAIYRLTTLVNQSALRVLMFAESSVVNAITRACKKLGIEWFEIRLTGLPKNDVRDYLEWRFQQAQYRGRLPFTDGQVDEIAKRSGGNPGVVDNLANELLSKLETGELKRQTSKFPVVHGVLALLLTCIVGLVYMLVVVEEDLPDQVTAAAPVQATPLPAESLELATVETPTSEETPFADGAVDDPVLEEPPVQQAEAPQIELDEAVPETDAPVTAEPLEVETEPAPEPPATVSEPVVVDRTEPAVEDAVEEIAVVEPEQPPAQTTSTRGQSWILAQDPALYTLQLVTVSSRERAESFIARQDDPAEFAAYDIERNGQTLHVVIYGAFSSEAAAQREAGRLTGELADLNPWVRPMRLVQDAAR